MLSFFPSPLAQHLSNHLLQPLTAIDLALQLATKWHPLDDLRLALAAAEASETTADEAVLAEEIGRMRHHAELTAMMCLHLSNAAELAVAICTQSSPPPNTGGDDELARDLQSAQCRLVHEALTEFEHGRAERGATCVGTLEDCIK